MLLQVCGRAVGQIEFFDQLTIAVLCGREVGVGFFLEFHLAAELRLALAELLLIFFPVAFALLFRCDDISS